MKELSFKGFKEAKTDDEAVSVIGELIERGAFDPKIRQLAISIVRHCPPRDYMCEVKAIWRWMRENIRYVHDIDGVDTYHTARAIAFKLRAGDCDDLAILAGALLAAIGYPLKIRIVSRYLSPEKGFSHIYILVGIPAGVSHESVKKWIPLEFTVPIPFGKEVKYARKRDYKLIIDGSSVNPEEYKD